MLRWIVANKTITKIFVVQPTIDGGWAVRVGDERLGLFPGHRQALDDVKKRRAKLTSKGERSTVVISKLRMR